MKKLFKQNGFTDMYIKGEHRSEHAIMLCYTTFSTFFLNWQMLAIIPTTYKW